MDILALLIGGASLMVSSGVLWWSRQRLDSLSTATSPPPPPAYDDRALRTALDQHADILDDHAEELEKQRLAIAEGIERVDRAERRIRSTVTRAKARMEELGYDDPTLSAEYESLPPDDGRGSGAGRVQSVPQSVEVPQAEDMSAFPGDWS